MAKSFLPSVWLWFALVLAILACVVAGLLTLSSSMTPLEHHWQLPEKLGLGQAATFTLSVNAWKRPTDTCLQITCDQQIDWQTPVRWQWQQFTCRGSIWKTSIKFWAHAPGQEMSGQVIFLPTADIFPLPALTITLPEQQLQPVWREASESTMAPSHNCAPGSWLIILFLICGCSLGVGLNMHRRQKNAQLQQSLQRLSSATNLQSAEHIHQVMVSFFNSHPNFIPRCDLRHLAFHWRWRQTSNAWLAPSLQYLAERLEHLRFQNPRGHVCPPLDSYAALAAFILRNYQQENEPRSTTLMGQ